MLLYAQCIHTYIHAYIRYAFYNLLTRLFNKIAVKNGRYRTSDVVNIFSVIIENIDTINQPIGRYALHITNFSSKNTSKLVYQLNHRHFSQSFVLVPIMSLKPIGSSYCQTVTDIPVSQTTPRFDTPSECAQQSPLQASARHENPISRSA